MSSILYASFAAGFQTIKHGISKAVLSNYSKTTTVINMIFMKHVIKSLLYVLLIILLSKESLFNSFGNLKNLFTDSISFKNSKSTTILISMFLVALVEIAYAFPYYNGIRLFDLSIYILMITIFTILFNAIIGYFYFNEKFNVKKSMGILLCIIGITFIKLSNNN